MCRLLAFSFSEKTQKQNRLNLISSFRNLADSGMVPATISKGHNDGWGFSLYGNGNTNIYKSISSAHKDDSFDANSFLKEDSTQSGLVHLRKKTVGETSISNTHPFVDGLYSFIHNGSVVKGSGPYEDLSSLCAGETDSERLFRKFLEIRKDKETLESYVEMLSGTKEKYPEFSAMNTILHDGDTIYVSRVVNTNNPKYEEFNLENYYTLWVGTSKDGDIVVSSEKINDGEIDYSLIPNNSVCVIDTKSKEQKLLSI